MEAVHKIGHLGDLPEELLALIFRELPPAAHCRFRCVSKAWKRLLSSSPDWTHWKRRGTNTSIVTSRENFGARVLSHSDKTWVRFPGDDEMASKFRSWTSDKLRHWNLVDVDKGFLCYLARGMKEFSIAVCNPVTNSFEFMSVRNPVFQLWFDTVKLLVDHDKKRFKLFCVVLETRRVALLDSHSRFWDFWLPEFPEEANHFFAWKNVIYAYSTRPKASDVFYAFDLNLLEEDEMPNWEELPVKLPDGEADRYILCHEDVVMLVQFTSSGKGSLFEVWRLSWNLDFSTSTWENLHVGRKISEMLDSNQRCFVDACLGTGHACFIFTTGLELSYGTKAVTEKDVCVQYMFATGSCSEIARPSLGKNFRSVFSWEPNVDAQVDEYMRLNR